MGKKAKNKFQDSTIPGLQDDEGMFAPDKKQPDKPCDESIISSPETANFRSGVAERSYEN